MDLMDYRRKIIANSPHLASASGAIASFADGADDLPLKSLVVDINPVQDLSHGDPSPENICPISGWEGMAVNATGKNLLAKPFAFRPAPSSLSDCFFAKAGTYHFSFDGIGTATKWRFGISMFDAQGNALSGNDYKPNINFNFITSVNMWYFGADVTSKSFSFTLLTDCYIRIWFGSGNTTASMTATDAQLELGSTATPYEPYTGRSIPISLQTEAGTVYGGKLDVLSGVLTAYHYYASYNGETLTGRWVSDRNKYVAGTTPTIGAQVVDMSGTGITYHIDPKTVRTLYGNNNIFADTGNVALECWAHP